MQLADLVDHLVSFLGETRERPFLLGVSGGQGAGKTTLCGALTQALSARNKNCLSLALDDFYLSKSARAALAFDIHPNCMTRGVPGTHDVSLLADTLARLKQADPDTQTPLPAFSKSLDDRLPSSDWGHYSGRPDIIILEGWCVGGRTEFLADQPATDWERKTDSHNIWKQWSLAQAETYRPIWDACDATLLLRQESFEAVIDSRWLQEQGNAAESGIWQFENRDAVAAFCAHYESWTMAIWRHLPTTADFTVIRDAAFNYRLA